MADHLASSLNNYSRAHSPRVIDAFNANGTLWGAHPKFELYVHLSQANHVLSSFMFDKPENANVFDICNLVLLSGT